MTILPILASWTVVTLALPELVEMAQQRSEEGPNYSYNMSYEEGDVSATGRIDPSKPVGERITVTNPPEETWSEDFRKELAAMEENVGDDMWCAEFAETIPTDAKLEKEDAMTATYAFRPLPDPDDKDDAKFVKNIVGSATLAKEDGAILHYSMTAPKPFKPAMIAKIHKFNMDVTCARAPDGRTYTADMQISISGKAMMQKFDEKMRRQISDLKIVE